MNQYRKYITSSVGFAFLVVGTTGIIFKFFFKNHVLQDIHGWLGVIMVLAASLHIFQNWTSLRSHLRNKKVLSLLLPILAIIALISLAPEDEKRGVNPRQIMHKLSQGSVSTVAAAFGNDFASVLSLMKKDGIRVTNESETLEAIAQENHQQSEALLGYFMK